MAAKLKSDNQGFLIGEPIDIDRTFKIWAEIRDDMRALRASLAGKNISSERISPVKSITDTNRRYVKKEVVAAIPIQRSTAKIERKHTTTAAPVTSLIEHKQNPVVAQPMPRVLKVENQRDSAGRFVSKENPRARFSTDDIGTAAEKIAAAFSSTKADLSETDPAVKAFSEVAEPMSRGYQSLTTVNPVKEHKSQQRWFKRIFGELSLFRKEETAFNKAANKSLKNIEETQGTDDSGSNSWMRYLMPTLTGIAGLLTGLVAAVTNMPVDDLIPQLERAFDKATKAVKSFFTPPIFKLIDNWDEIGKKVTETLDWFQNLLGSAWNSFAGFIKDKLGIDINAAITSTVDTVRNSTVGKFVSEKANAAKEWVSNKAGEAGEWAMQKGADAAEKGSTALKKVFDEDADIGKSSAKFEATDAGTISTGKGDHGGISYGKYQMSSKFGVPQRFLQTYSQYGDQFKGMTINTPEFQVKWKEIAKNDAKFGDAQHEYVRKNFYNILMHNLEKSGIDLSGRSAAVKEMVFSTSVQHGPNTKVINDALKGRDISKMSDAEMITEVQRFKNQNVESHHRNSAPNIRAGVLKRTVAEENYLLSMLDSPTPKAQQIKTASAPPVVPPSMPSQVQSIPDAPRIAEPLNTSASRKQPSNPMVEPDVGQDVKDRKIAHIVTGGLSN